MKTNTLVTHNKLKTLGIGCVSKVMGSKLKVNFGTEDVLTCSKTAVREIDTSKSKTISFSEFQAKSMNNSFKENSVIMIIGNEVKEYVGIGWITLRTVTMDDLTKYKRVV